MDLLALKYFCEAAERESFSRVAEKNLVPTSSISQVIKRLEGELGTALFERYGNKVSLNENGKRFYDGAKRALAELESAKQSVTEENGDLRGMLRIFVGANRMTVTNVIEAFHEKHPSVTFSVSHSFDPYAEYDVIISESAPDRELLRIPFVREKLLLAVSERNPLGKKKEILPSDIADEKFILMPKNTSLTRATEGIFATLSVSPEVSVICDDPTLIRRYVELGIGIAVVPSVSWGGVFSESTALLDIGEFYRETCIFVKAKNRTKRTDAFIEELKSFSVNV